MKSKGFAAVAGLLAAVFLGLALWPRQEAMSPMVVAARDLGAGTQLAATDLQVRMVPAAELPPDALTAPEPLLEQTLSVVRFAGETVALNHLGPAIALAPDERGIAVRVKTDSGLAGLLQPGQRVGLVAVVSDWQGQNQRGYAKALIENVRILWIAPSFRLHPDSFLPDSPDTAPQPVAREGIIVLAASTLPEPVLYDTQHTLHVRALRRAQEARATDDGNDLAAIDPALLEEDLPDVVWSVPLEMIASLNHIGASFMLVLQPPNPDPWSTPGFSIDRMIAPLLDGESS